MRYFTILARSERGAAVVEFALILPMLATLLLGVLGYGQYFLLAHSVQQLANDAARATAAGISAPERATLAGATLTRELATLPEIRRNNVTLGIVEAADLVTVRVRLDASAIALFRVPLLPMPDPLIERSAVVRPGGIA